MPDVMPPVPALTEVPLGAIFAKIVPHPLTVVLSRRILHLVPAERVDVRYQLIPLLPRVCLPQPLAHRIQRRFDPVVAVDREHAVSVVFLHWRRGESGHWRWGEGVHFVDAAAWCNCRDDERAIAERHSCELVLCNGGSVIWEKEGRHGQSGSGGSVGVVDGDGDDA